MLFVYQLQNHLALNLLNHEFYDLYSFVPLNPMHLYYIFHMNHRKCLRNSRKLGCCRMYL
eukprot:UN16401